jgi:hypothetical protein
MKSKRKDKMSKSNKTRFADLTPKRDARGGKLPEAPYPDGGPSKSFFLSARSKKVANA